MKATIGAYFALLFLGIAWWLIPSPSLPDHVGRELDEWQGVPVYDNGPYPQDTYGKNTAPDGYVFGWKYQCVEFIKRYYFIRFRHRMPEGQGNARDFWDSTVLDGGRNHARGLVQFNVPSAEKVRAEDILVYGHAPVGHVALVTAVRADSIFLIQQNVGTQTRDTLFLRSTPAGYRISDERIRGWLRHPRTHVF